MPPVDGKRVSSASSPSSSFHRELGLSFALGRVRDISESLTAIKTLINCGVEAGVEEGRAGQALKRVPCSLEGERTQEEGRTSCGESILLRRRLRRPTSSSSNPLFFGLSLLLPRSSRVFVDALLGAAGFLNRSTKLSRPDAPRRRRAISAERRARDPAEFDEVVAIDRDRATGAARIRSAPSQRGTAGRRGIPIPAAFLRRPIRKWRLVGKGGGDRGGPISVQRRRIAARADRLRRAVSYPDVSG